MDRRGRRVQRSKYSLGFFVERDRGRLRTGWRLLAQVVIFQAATFLILAPAYGDMVCGRLLQGFLRDFLRRFRRGPHRINGYPIPREHRLSRGIFFSLWLMGRFIDRRSLKDYGFHLDVGWWFDLAFGLGLGMFLISGDLLARARFRMAPR